MTDEPAPSPIIINQPAPPPEPVSAVTTYAKWAAGVCIAIAVLAMEVKGLADRNTFLNYIAVPCLTVLGLHTAAKSLN